MNIIRFLKLDITKTRFYPGDISSGAAVFIVATPLCLGIAHASGTPVLSGIVSGIIGGVVVGLVSKSPLSVSGPAAGLTAIVLHGLSVLGGFENLLASIIIAGIFQIILGSVRAGVLINFFPNSVIKGMLCAIGLILISKQFPHLLGYDIEQPGVEEFNIHTEDLSDMNPLKTQEKSTFTILLHSFSNINNGIAILGILSLGVIIAWEKFFSRNRNLISSSLVAIVFGVVLNFLYLKFFPEFAIKDQHLLNLPENYTISDFYNRISFPDLKLFGNYNVYYFAIVLTVVASLESLLSIEAIDKLDPRNRQTPKNRELIAQGIGNIFAGFTGGLPVTSVIVRSTVNLSSGAKSRFSSILHGVFLFIAVLFGARYMNQIPFVTLAAILSFIGYKLAAPRVFIENFKKGLNQFIPFVATVIAILFSDMLIGIFIGFNVAIVFILKSYYDTTDITIKRNGKFIRIIIGESLSFLRKARLIDALSEIQEGSFVEIDASKAHYLDSDILEVIREFKQGAKELNIETIIIGVKNMEIISDEYRQRIDQSYNTLLERNLDWASRKVKEDPDFFRKLSEGQNPEFLFIGCSDSRVSVNLLTNTDPGEIFVHRNIANIVNPGDMNLMSVLEFAIEHLKIKHIIVCGHYGCGGIKAAMNETIEPNGMISNWITQIRETQALHSDELSAISFPEERERKLVEYHVVEQVKNLYKSPVVFNAIRKYGFPILHSWVYDISTGKIKSMEFGVDGESIEAPGFTAR
ncbi:MAG: sulfate permease [Leptospira sp.]|nr:sulfate permease [Leptospira sp.]